MSDSKKIINELKIKKLKLEVSDLKWWRRPYITNSLAIILVASVTYGLSADRLQEIIESQDTTIQAKNDSIKLVTNDLRRYDDSLKEVKGKFDSLDRLNVYYESQIASLQDSLNYIIQNKELELGKLQTEIDNTNIELLKTKHFIECRNEYTKSAQQVKLEYNRVLDYLGRLYEGDEPHRPLIRVIKGYRKAYSSYQDAYQKECVATYLYSAVPKVRGYMSRLHSNYSSLNEIITPMIAPYVLKNGEIVDETIEKFDSEKVTNAKEEFDNYYWQSEIANRLKQVDNTIFEIETIFSSKTWQP